MITVADLRATLVAIQELHEPVKTQVLVGDCAVEECEHEDDCPTRDFEYCAACNEIAEEANPYYAEDGMGFVLPTLLAAAFYAVLGVVLSSRRRPR